MFASPATSEANGLSRKHQIKTAVETDTCFQCHKDRARRWCVRHTCRCLPTPATGGQLHVKGHWRRLEALAKYTFDKDRVRAMGINGEAYAKLRYVWESNSVNNFDQDIM